MSTSTTIIRKGRVFVKTDGGEPVALGQDAAGTGSVKASRLPELYNQTEVNSQATSVSSSEIEALNLGTASQSNAGDFATAPQGFKADSALQPANNLSDLAVASTARTNLGLGSAATAATTDFATATQGAKADTALQAANNLSDLAAKPTARANLDLGTIATQAANSVALTGGTISGATIVIPTAAPASASASGTAGTITWDADYVYVCTATNTWKRVAISTW